MKYSKAIQYALIFILLVCLPGISYSAPIRWVAKADINNVNDETHAITGSMSGSFIFDPDTFSLSSIELYYQNGSEVTLYDAGSAEPAYVNNLFFFNFSFSQSSVVDKTDTIRPTIVMLLSSLSNSGKTYQVESFTENNNAQYYIVIETCVSSDCASSSGFQKEAFQGTISSAVEQSNFSSCASAVVGTVTSDLKICMPSLYYTTPSGTQNIWADFEYYGNGPNGELLWKSKGYGTNQ